jgi:hypothetical protein
LRRGTSEIVAVGRAVRHRGEVRGIASEENKSWLKDFDGWDLPAYCYVEWHEPEKAEPAHAQLAQSAVSRVRNVDIRRQAKRILEERPTYASCYDGPPSTNCVPLEVIEEFFKERLGVDSSRRAVSTIHDIRRLADTFYKVGSRYWDEFKEHEIRTFLIVPLLLALGWRREQIKIELNPGRLGVQSRDSIDIACFSEDYRPGYKSKNRENCRLVIESKRFSSGVANVALAQAERYARPLPNCNSIVVTNGYCYKAFEGSHSTRAFSKRPSAYLNIREPRDRYPLDPDHVHGSLEVLRLLLPQAQR